MNKMAKIQASSKNVFSAQDLAVLWEYSDKAKLFETIKYYVRTEQIYIIARGLYSKNRLRESDLRNNERLQSEIANKLVPNSYVSLWSILKKEGVIFQYYDEVYSVAKRSVIREVLGVKFVYKQIKESILLNNIGINVKEGIRVASIERAKEDMKYLYPKVNIC